MASHSTFSLSLRKGWEPEHMRLEIPGTALLDIFSYQTQPSSRGEWKRKASPIDAQSREVMTGSRYQLTESLLEILSFQNPKAWTVSQPKSLSLEFRIESSKKNKCLSWGAIWKPWFCLVGMEVCLEKTFGWGLLFNTSQEAAPFFLSHLKIFLVLVVWFFSLQNFLGFFQHCKEIASLVTRVMLFRDMKNLRWTKNYRISCNCNTWKKMKTWSEDLSSPAQQLVTPGSSTAFRPCLLPPCCPWDKQLSGHADALLLATWVQIFPYHSSCCAYNSTGSA